jgi:hypothetical protein
MALYPGSARYGLRLWDHPLATAIVEGGGFALAVWSYARATEPVRPAGRRSFYGFVAVLALMYAGSFAAVAPPSASAMAAGNTIMLVLLTAWALTLDLWRRPAG